MPASSVAWCAAFLTVLLPVFASPAFAQTPGEEETIYNRIETIHGDAEGFLQTADELADAMERGDFAVVASMAEYPLVVKANGETYDIIEAEDLVGDFTSLVSPRVRKQVASFTLGNLIVTSDGVGFADGGLWMGSVCGTADCSRNRWVITRIDDLNPAYEEPESEPSAREVPSSRSGEFPLAAGSWGGKVRSGPGQQHRQVASLQDGDRITLLERTSEFYLDNPWFRIEMADGEVGYHWGGVICGLEEPIPGAFEICDR